MYLHLSMSSRKCVICSLFFEHLMFLCITVVFMYICSAVFCLFKANLCFAQGGQSNVLTLLLLSQATKYSTFLLFPTGHKENGKWPTLLLFTSLMIGHMGERQSKALCKLQLEWLGAYTGLFPLFWQMSEGVMEKWACPAGKGKY